MQLLNIDEQIRFEIISTGNPSEEVQISMRNKDVEEEVVDARSGVLGWSGLLTDSGMVWFAMLSAVPFFGGFARSMINVGVARRISKLDRRP